MNRNNMRIILQIVDVEFANARLGVRSVRDVHLTETGRVVIICQSDVQIHAGISRCIPPDIFVVCIAYFNKNLVFKTILELNLAI